MTAIEKQPIVTKGSVEFGTIGSDNHLYYSKHRSEIRKLNGHGEINRTYVNWHGNSEKWFQLIIPKNGRKEIQY